MKINAVTLCSGYGAQEMALDRLKRDYPDFDWELLAWAEIEHNAIKAHQACHPEYADRNLGDITVCDYSKITQPVDLLVYSTPCQSVSVAGQNKGMKEGSDATSALIWHTRRAIETLKPKVCILENVRGMIMGKNVKEFHKWQHVMESYGYTNFAKVLDSSQYGIPQHRERLFMVSIRDCTQSYHFPEPFKLEKRIKDILEPYGTVDESFYFSAKQLLGMFKYCAKKKDEGCGFQTQFTDENGIASCVTTRYGASYTDAYLKEPALQQRLSLYGNNAQAGRVYDVDGIAPCLDTCCGGNRMPKILTPVRTEEAKELRRKGVEVFKHRELVPREDGVSNTITTIAKDNLLIEPTDRQSKIRSKVMSNGNIRFYQDDESKSGISEMQIIHPDNECPTITTAHVPKILEPVAVAMRGRNPDNPSDRTKGAPTEQRLEFGDSIANCITTVQKDSMVAEPMVGNDPRKAFGVEVYSDICPTLVATDYKSPKIVREPIELSFDNLPDETVLKDEDGKGYLWQDGGLWRVRKLVPIEVFRLQDVSDEDAKKIIAVCSKSACYQLAGNSITCAVLYHIFRKLWINPGNESAQKSLFDF